MAQGRMLKKRTSKSRKFAALKTHAARLLYLMMLPHLDIAGRLEATPDLVKTEVVPLLNLTEKQILEYLEDMHRVGLIILYRSNGEHYLQYTRFNDFQTLREDREAKSTFPPPPPELLHDKSSTTPGVPPPKDKLSKDKSIQDKLSKGERKIDKPIVGGTGEKKKKLLDQLPAAQRIEKE